MKIKSFLSAIFVLMISASLSFAQTNVKIGYTNPEYIVSLMPEYKQVESELKSYEKQLQAQLEGKMKEYQTKLDDYQKNVGTWPDVVKQDKEKELLGMQSNIKEFEENAMSSMQKKQGQLLDPILDKIQKAIDAVAQENGYTYIFNSATSNNSAIILYAKNKDEDVSELILKKLGVTPPAKTEGTTPSANPGGNKTTNTTTAPIKNK